MLKQDQDDHDGDRPPVLWERETLKDTRAEDKKG